MQPKRILVIEDDAPIRQGIADALRFHGYQALEADGGADSLERALRVDPGQVPVLRNLAQLYERRGFRHKAIETWHRALLITTEAERRQEILKHLERLLSA